MGIWKTRAGEGFIKKAKKKKKKISKTGNGRKG